MDPRCNHIRDRLLAEALACAAGAPPAPELAEHLADCAGCAGVWERVRRQVEALGALDRLAAPGELAERVRSALLPEGQQARAVASLGRLGRVAVPEELEGRVVSAVHSGYLQDRAVAAVVGLGRQSAPRELEHRVLVGSQCPPDVLDRLVPEELADPAKAMSRRFVRRLSRLRAPASLERRLEALIASGSRAGGRQPRRLLAPIAAAAAVLLALWAGGRAWLGPSEPQEPPFRVMRAATIGDLGSMARALADGVGGGILEAREGGGR